MNSTASDETSNAASPGLTTAIGSVAVFFIALELTIISVAMPEIADDFTSSSRATLSWIFTAYNVGVASLLLIGGWLAERFGRKRVFLIGLAIFTIGSVGSGLAPTVGVLIASRVVQAIGGALLVPASLGLILHAVEPAKRDVAIGVWGAMAGLAAAIGPTLGAVLVSSVGWRSVFLVNVPVAIVVAVLAWQRVEESLDPNIASSVDLLAVPAGAFGVGIFVFDIVAGSTLGWTSPVTLGTMVLGVGLVVLFIRRSTRHPHPVFEPEIASRRSFIIGGVGTLCFVAGFTGWLVLAPTFLTEVWDYSVLRAGLAIAPGPLVMAVVAGPAGKLASKRGHRVVITAGALFSLGAVLWWTTQVGSDPSYAAGLLPGLILMGIGVGFGFPMLTAVSMLDVPSHQYAMGAAGSTTIRQLAMAVGIAIAVAIVGTPENATGAFDQYRWSWIVAGAFFAVTAVAMQLLGDQPVHEQPTHEIHDPPLDITDRAQSSQPSDQATGVGHA